VARVRVSVDVDTAAVERMVDEASRGLSPPGVTDAVVAAAEVFRDGARRRAPHRSGRLAGSISTRPVGGFSAVTSTDLIYAQITEFGGTIRPVHAKVLAFNPGGGVVFARRTRVPSQPYWLPTFDQDTELAVDAFADSALGS